MSWIESTLTRLEGGLRELIEGEPAVDGIARKFHNQLERKLRVAVRNSVRKLPEEDPHEAAFTAPDKYTLLLPAVEAQLLLTHPAELDRLAHLLETLAAQSGIVFGAAPIISVVADPQSTEMKVVAEFSQSGGEDSATTQVEGLLDNGGQAPNGNMPKAFLIINGFTTFPLTEPVVNIGRDPSNQVYLDDLRVSRKHAQLRLSQERFVIFDLDSLGGTFVNGVAVSSRVLNPGDVILLAGVPLVYGQEEIAQVGYTQELPVDPPAPEVL
jgi:hypothetical protein